MNAQPLPLRFELLSYAQRLGNAAEDLAGTPQAAILLKANRDLHKAVRKLDALPVPMNVELLGKSAELVEAGKRLIANLERCEDDGAPIDDGACLGCVGEPAGRAAV